MVEKVTRIGHKTLFRESSYPAIELPSVFMGFRALCEKWPTLFCCTECFSTPRRARSTRRVWTFVIFYLPFFVLKLFSFVIFVSSVVDTSPQETQSSPISKTKAAATVPANDEFCPYQLCQFGAANTNESAAGQLRRSKTCRGSKALAQPPQPRTFFVINDPQVTRRARKSSDS